MTELWLKFETDDGETRRLKVDQEEFVIGRHSECDLCIPNASISRQHLKINSAGNEFVISDCASTFGTTINREKLAERSPLVDGDILVLGGDTEILIELADDGAEEAVDPAADKTSSTGDSAQKDSAASGSIPRSFFYLAPIFCLLILLCAGGGLYIAFSGGSGGSGSSRTGRDDNALSATPDRASKKTRQTDSPTPDSGGQPQSTGGNDPLANQEQAPAENPAAPQASNEVDKVRTYSASFLSRIVAKDREAFLLDRHVQMVIPTINKFRSSSALAGNMADVKKNASTISATAAEKGLLPEFLTAATLAKLGNNRGDVVATAQKMAGILQRLQSVIGVELADEATVVVAAYYQGESGSFDKMQNTLQGLSGGNIEGVSARQIRTIWFLNERGKLKPEEFELAIRFIAVGTIMQKPDEFEVKAEALTFN